MHAAAIDTVAPASRHLAVRSRRPHPGNVTMASLLETCTPFKHDGWWVTNLRITGRILARVDVDRMAEVLRHYALVSFGHEEPSADELEDMISRWSIALLTLRAITG